MTIKEFKDSIRTGRALDTEDIHIFMDEMSDAARRITFRLNAAYHTPAEVRRLLSELFGYDVPSSLRVFPPFYTDFGKNITVGEDVFINACCHFQDHGGVVLGDGCQIGHNVVFATLNHGLSPEDRKHTYPAPIVLGKNVWVGSNATILQGVTIGDNAVVAAGAVVNKNVPDNVVVGGVPARIIKKITEEYRGVTIIRIPMRKILFLLLLWAMTDIQGMAQEKITQTAEADGKAAFQREMIFPIGEPNTAYAKYFIGNSYLAPISKEQIPFSNVTFEPGCRNNWHIHHATKGGWQMLVCVAGRGWYQEEGKPAVRMLPGDVIHIPANVKHWHGAAADSWFAHLAFEVPGENLSNEWLEPVSDEEYNRLEAD